MRGAIMQPYFFPYLGYFQLVYEVERFVFLDDVNYIKKGYINRNSILLNGARHEFSVAVSKVSQNRTIRNHDYVSEFTGFLKLIEQNYRKAPYFHAVMPLIEKVALDSNNNVACKNAKSVRSVFDYLGVSRDFSFSSDTHLEQSCKGQDRIIALCKKLGIEKYRNAIGGQDIYSQEAFFENDIELKFIQSNIQPYAQGKHEFVSHLSIIDMLMHCDKKTIQEHISNYSLV
ncbi:WbqC-like protein family [Comamonas testosteroni]|uniref:WbqC-like protein family n=2 Tax=Comamonas testosteroni TaxID=285 RepID=A0A8B4S912_COMTE|nr:hypothetical protein CTATCC11996_04182 [Comamonas testosteroni ATCC 11996]SUY79734.1 WbqC-like protein family [Comamonas testosteroni]